MGISLLKVVARTFDSPFIKPMHVKASATAREGGGRAAHLNIEEEEDKTIQFQYAVLKFA